MSGGVERKKDQSTGYQMLGAKLATAFHGKSCRLELCRDYRDFKKATRSAFSCAVNASPPGVGAKRAL